MAMMKEGLWKIVDGTNVIPKYMMQAMLSLWSNETEPLFVN